MCSIDLHIETTIMHFRFRVASVLAVVIRVAIVIVVVPNALPLC